MDEKNKLYFGDNLKILREYVSDASVDLIYLDPPFNSSATYNVLFKEKSGEESAAQITAFEDTWQWSQEAEAVYREIVESGPRKLADLMQALLAFLARNDMMAFLTTMASCLVALKRLTLVVVDYWCGVFLNPTIISALLNVHGVHKWTFSCQPPLSWESGRLLGRS